jgi:hypothetical protein
MLEICPPSLCAYELHVPGRRHGTGAPNPRRSCVKWGGSTGAPNPPRSCANWGGRHSWLCSVQYAAAAVGHRVTPPGPASLRTAGSRNSRRWIITIVESYSCRMCRITHLKSYSCGKIGGAPPPSAIMLLTFSLSIRDCGMSRYKRSARNPSRIRTYGSIRLKVHLESTLTSKAGWGVSPPSVFLP